MERTTALSTLFALYTEPQESLESWDFRGGKDWLWRASLITLSFASEKAKVYSGCLHWKDDGSHRYNCIFSSGHIIKRIREDFWFWTRWCRHTSLFLLFYFTCKTNNKSLNSGEKADQLRNDLRNDKMVSSWSLLFSPLYLVFYAGGVCNPETSTIKKKKFQEKLFCLFHFVLFGSGNVLFVCFLAKWPGKEQLGKKSFW